MELLNPRMQKQKAKDRCSAAEERDDTSPPNGFCERRQLSTPVYIRKRDCNELLSSLGLAGLVPDGNECFRLEPEK